MVDAILAAWLKELGAPIVVLRPDRYVLGTAQTTHDLEQLAKLLPKLCA